MRRYLTRVFRLTGRATGVQQANEKTVTSAPVNISVTAPSNGVEPQVEPLMGWGAETLGAWGHPDGVEPQVLVVNSLDWDTSVFRSRDWVGGHNGTLQSALSQPFPRIIVFEVAGVIDMQDMHFIVDSEAPYITIAGQTAPNPGITLIRGQLTLRNHDFIAQHIKIRPGGGAGGRNCFRVGWDAGDGYDVYNVLIDQCSLTWAGVSGFAMITIRGEAVNVAHDVTVSNSIICEALKNNPPEVDAGQGTGFSTRYVSYNIAIVRNLFNNWSRNPLCAGSHGAYINNYMSGWGNQPMYGVLPDEEAAEGYTVEWSLVGNYGRAGSYSRGIFPETSAFRGFFRGQTGVSHIYFEDNTVKWPNDVDDWLLFNSGSSSDVVVLPSPPHWHNSFDQAGLIVPSSEIRQFLESRLGARPWDRDHIDQRIVNQAYRIGGQEPIHPSRSQEWGNEPFVYPTTPNPVPTRTFDISEWEWHDGKQGLTEEKRVLINKATGSYAHPEDL